MEPLEECLSLATAIFKKWQKSITVSDEELTVCLRRLIEATEDLLEILEEQKIK